MIPRVKSTGCNIKYSVNLPPISDCNRKPSRSSSEATLVVKRN